MTVKRKISGPYDAKARAGATIGTIVAALVYGVLLYTIIEAIA